MISILGIVLHTGQGLTLGGYLLQVIFHLLAIIGIGVTVYALGRAIETIRSKNGRRERISDWEP